MHRSLGLSLLECATGRYPYDASGGPLQLMIQVCTNPTAMSAAQASCHTAPPAPPTEPCQHACAGHPKVSFLCDAECSVARISPFPFPLAPQINVHSPVSHHCSYSHLGLPDQASALLVQVVEDPVPVPDERRHSAEFASFVRDCMAKDPFARPCADALLSHPFILKACRSPLATLLSYTCWRQCSQNRPVLPALTQVPLSQCLLNALLDLLRTVLQQRGCVCAVQHARRRPDVRGFMRCMEDPAAQCVLSLFLASITQEHRSCSKPLQKRAAC